MSNNNVLKGVFLVGFVRPVMYASHFCKMAYNEGYTTAEVTTSQFILGIIGNTY
jgi:hypothetical protein